jgi:phosphonate transport system substrate-binding protein
MLRSLLRLLLPPSVGAARARARAELLDQSLRADLAEQVEVVVAKDYAELSMRADSDAHLVWMPPTICARHELSLRAIYKSQRVGRTSFRSAIIVRATSDIESVGGLRGKRFAWVDRLSVGGYLLALALLRRAGLAKFLGSQEFVGSYPDALTHVVSARADATALTVRTDSDEAVRDALASFGGRRATESLRPLCFSEESPNDALVITQVLDERRAAKLEEHVFARRGARARAALCLALDAESFVKADRGEYAHLRELLPQGS